MRETWYVLEDGTAGDPSDVAPDKSGALRHKDGRAVAMRGDVPHTSGVDVEKERAKSARGTSPHGKDMKPEEHKRGYKTRESKSD